MTDQQTIDRLDALVTRLEALGIPDVEASPRAPVNPDGSPGNVAAGELIESAWGNAVVDTLWKRARGVYSRIYKPSFEGGFSPGVEFAIAGLAGTSIASSGRLTTVHYSLIMTPQTLPVTNSWIGIQLRQTNVAGQLLGRAMHHYLPNHQAFGAGGLNISGKFDALGLASSTYMVLTSQTGAGSVAYEGSSYLMLEDVGGGL